MNLSQELLSNDLFQGISENTIKGTIMPAGKTLSFKQGTSLFFPQDCVSDIIILISGSVELVYYLENGNQNIQHILSEGSIVGIDLIGTRTKIAPYQAEAAKDCTVFTFPAELILISGKLSEKERAICLENLLSILSHVNMQNEYRMAILMRHSLRERVLVYLNMQANKRRKSSFTIPFSRDKMAAFLNVNRSALSHELSLLKSEGIIDFRKNEFTLLKWQENDPREPFDLHM